MLMNPWQFITAMSIRDRLFLLLGISAIALTSVGLIGINGMNKGDALNNLNALITVYHKQQHTRETLAKLGYAGAIHKFKNYVIRLRHDDLEGFLSGTGRLYGHPLRCLDEVGMVNEKESKAAQQLLEMLDKYEKAAKTAAVMIEQGASIIAIDRAIKISDKPYIDAIQTLNSELLKSADLIVEHVGRSSSAFAENIKVIRPKLQLLLPNRFQPLQR